MGRPDQPAPAMATTAIPIASAPPAPAVTRRINVPLLPVTSGDPQLDANQRAILWAGDVSTHDHYFDARLVGADDGLRVRVQVFDQQVQTGDRVAVTFGDTTVTAAWPATTGWTVGQRCGSGDCRGWDAEARLPWAQLGGMPQPGDTWPLTVTVRDADGTDAPSRAQWTGTLHWGLPDYAGEDVPGAQVLTTALTADAMVGGGTDCGAPDYPTYFPGWGKRSWATSPYVNIQSQWDVADWPCYARYYTAWPLDELPAGARVVSATLTLHQFGQAGYSAGDTAETVVQVYEVADAWDEATVTWDSAPLPTENTARLAVPEAPCGYCAPGLPYAFDVTEIVRRAQAAGRTSAAAALYTAAGQYHSGKYFWSRRGAEPPVVRMAYVPEGTGSGGALTNTPMSTATATATRTPPPPTATATNVPPTATATAPPTSAPPTASATVAPTLAAPGRTFYLSPTGRDRASGVSPGTAWATFDRAWQALQPGDTLVLLDGVYRETLQPDTRNGEPGRPITIRAQHDGKAIVDGEGQRIPIYLGEVWPGPIGNWFVLEGLVARNSSDDVIIIRGNHNVLRRVSAYDADPNANTSVITVAWTHDILIEDCLTAGTGRKQILLFGATDLTVRRCFVQWTQWDGQAFCNAGWPAGNGIHVYGSSQVRIENAIATGPAADRLIGITNQSDEAVISDVAILGSAAIGAGMNADGTVRQYPLALPNTCNYRTPPQFYDGERSGFVAYGQGKIDRPVFRDVLAIGNAAQGFASLKPYGIGVVDGVLDHATLLDNNRAGGHAPNLLTGFTVTNSRIEGAAVQGAGARLTHRYVDGVLTDEPLWPWPMDARAEGELGFRITDFLAPYLAR